MPQRAGEGSGARRKPKTSVETDEFASNPPFSKKELGGVLSHPTFRGNDGFKKIENLELKKKKNPELLQENFFKLFSFRTNGTFPAPTMSDPTKVWYPQTHRHRSQMQDFYFYWSLVHHHYCPSSSQSTAPLLR